MQHTHTSTYVTHIYTQQPHTVPMHVYCTDTTHTHKWPQIIPPAYAPVLLPTVHTYYIHVDIHTTSILITHTHKHIYFMGRPRCLSGKESTCQAVDVGSIPGSGRSTGEGNGNSLQYFFTWKKNFLTWKIPWIEEPGGLQSMGLQRVGHNWAAEQQQQYTSYHTNIHITLTVQTYIHKTHTIQNAQMYSTPLTWKHTSTHHTYTHTLYIHPHTIHVPCMCLTNVPHTCTEILLHPTYITHIFTYSTYTSSSSPTHHTHTHTTHVHTYVIIYPHTARTYIHTSKHLHSTCIYTQPHDTHMPHKIHMPHTTPLTTHSARTTHMLKLLTCPHT